jgi:hypothetical protein
MPEKSKIKFQVMSKTSEENFRIRESNPLLSLLECDFQGLKWWNLRALRTLITFASFLKAEYVNPYTNADVGNFCLF